MKITNANIIKVSAKNGENSIKLKEMLHFVTVMITNVQLFERELKYPSEYWSSLLMIDNSLVRNKNPKRKKLLITNPIFN